MLTFSDDPKRAEQQMHAIIFYLTTFGYIDGDFDEKEKAFVRDYIGKLVQHRADSSMSNAEPAVKADVVSKFTKHFLEVFDGINANVRDLFTESVSKDEDPTAFVHSRLKVRCFEIFQSFERPDQEALMALIDELLMADGVAHPAEVQFRGELASLLEADYGIEITEDEPTGKPKVRIEPGNLPASYADHPFFKPQEQHFSRDPMKIRDQVNQDLALIDRTMSVLEQQKKHGVGKLAGKKTLAELRGTPPFLDGHIYARMPDPGQRHELVVLGDLHGCYSVLKATLMQSHFFEKVDKYRAQPDKNPYPLLVLLGDYIDRGLFSLNGVLRTVLQLYVTAPAHVVVLRGNHEYYVEYQGNMYGGVKPAEAINSLKPHLSIDVFRRYRDLFDALPNVFFFDDIMFVHGGIAKDRLLKERFQDLSSLNDDDIRFQMLWSDPSTADVIPADLQDKASRFAFGRMQFRAFMQKIGAKMMIRGHEKVVSGFQRTYDDEQAKLFTLFSSGGTSNLDLPSDSSYREVTPMALTIEHGPDGTKVVPWAPDYTSYNDPARNAFFKMPPEIEHRG
jgi:hypothetical protein